MHGYSVYGLRVLTTRPIAGLIALGQPDAGDVRIDLGTLPPWLMALPADQAEPLYSSPYHDEVGQPLMTVTELRDGAFYRLRYSDGVEFIVDRPGGRIWTSWPDPWTLEDVATYLLGPILGFTLRLRGVTCLHASAVALDGWAVALLGPPGAGKSTLAASFAMRGLPVISDDVLALSHHDGRFVVEPGAPRIRLWPESVQALYGSREALPRLTPTWDKRFLDLTRDGYHFQRQRLPLGAIYLLGERGSEAAAPRIEDLSPTESLMALVANTHANHLLDDTMRSQEFECLGSVVRVVPVRRAIPHEDPAFISKVCDAILDDAQSLCERVDV